MNTAAKAQHHGRRNRPPWRCPQDDSHAQEKLTEYAVEGLTADRKGWGGLRP